MRGGVARYKDHINPINLQFTGILVFFTFVAGNSRRYNTFIIVGVINVMRVKLLLLNLNTIAGGGDRSRSNVQQIRMYLVVITFIVLCNITFRLSHR